MNKVCESYLSYAENEIMLASYIADKGDYAESVKHSLRAAELSLRALAIWILPLVEDSLSSPCSSVLAEALNKKMGYVIPTKNVSHLLDLDKVYVCVQSGYLEIDEESCMEFIKLSKDTVCRAKSCIGRISSRKLYAHV